VRGKRRQWVLAAFDAGMDIAVIVFSFDGTLALKLAACFTCGERRSESFVDKRGTVEVITMIYARCSFSGAFHVPIKYEGYLTKR